jgi:hypothetical protein
MNFALFLFLSVAVGGALIFVTWKIARRLESPWARSFVRAFACSLCLAPTALLVPIDSHTATPVFTLAWFSIYRPR